MFIAHIKDDMQQTCNAHSRKTAEYAAQSLASVGLEHTGYLSGLLHDVGKYSSTFDDYIRASARGERVQKGSVIHSFAGVRLALNLWHSGFSGETITDPWSNVTAEIIATAIGSHHGLFDEYDTSGKSGLKYRVNKQPVLDDEAALNFTKECINTMELNSFFGKAKNEVEAVAKKCSTLAQNSSQDEFMFYMGLLQRLIDSAVINGDRLDTAEFMTNSMPSCYSEGKPGDLWEKALDNLHEYLGAFPRETQMDIARSEMSDACEQFAAEEPGVYRLNLPTGGGKTLSGLRYALKHAANYKKKRIIFAVPLLSIIDQNAEIIKKAIDGEGYILEHHSNIVIEGSNSNDKSERDLLIQNWDAPIIITTLVQFLNTLFDGRTSCVRRFCALSNSVIILDEVQTIPDRMISLFNLAINFLYKICNATVILCSATQPTLEIANHSLDISEKEIIPIHIKHKYEEVFRRCTVDYKGEFGLDEIASLACEYADKYNSSLVICNTKKEASDLYKRLNTPECLHLSTSMCPAHRRQMIQEIRRRLDNSLRTICVSTQLIEAGVDVSFGAAIRFNAGLDSIMQTAGRCNRNAEKKLYPPVSIVEFKGEDLSQLKEIKRAKDASSSLVTDYYLCPEKYDNDLLSEKAIHKYYELYFKSINCIIGYTDYQVDGQTLYELLSDNRDSTSLVNEGELNNCMWQAFRTAGEKFRVFDEDQVQVVVPFEDGRLIINELLSNKMNHDLSFIRELIKKAADYTVSIFNNQFLRLKKEGALYQDPGHLLWILQPDYYDKKLGLVDDRKERAWNTLIL